MSGNAFRNITVEVRRVFGVPTIYPMCPQADLFALIAGTRTLTPTVIKHIRGLGYGVIVQHEEFTV